MNKTEVMAYNWLKQQGLDIYPADNPDIVCVDGTGYEVKLQRGRQIVFTSKQVNSLKSFPGQVKVLVFKQEDTEPYKVIPFDEIQDMPNYHNGVKIHVAGKKLAFLVTDEEFQLIRIAALNSDKTIKDWITDSIVAWIKKEVADGTLDASIEKYLDKVNKEE